MHRLISRLAAALFLSLSTAGVAFAADWGPLLTVEEAAKAESALIIDIRGEPAFKAGHAPGAVNAPYARWRGPAENPGRTLSDEALTDLLQGLGVTKDRPVIVAHQGRNATDFGSAARVYWTLKSAGIERIAIMNGGVDAWAAAGLAISTKPVAPTPSAILATLSDQWMIDREGVADVVAGKRAARLVDARPLEFFEGRKKHGAAAEAGTLKGALNVVHSAWFGEDDHLIVSTPEAAAAIAERAGYDGVLAPGEELVSFCNTGHWAATNWFALSEIAGIENVKLYPESLVGWTNAGGAVQTQ